MTFLAGQRALASQLVALETFATPLYTLKTLDETVTNSGTLQNDNELVLSVTANAVYDVTATIFYEAPTAQDIRVSFTWPAGATFPWGLTGLDVGTAGTAGNVRPVAFSNPSSGVDSFHVGGAGAGNILLVYIKGTLTVSSTSGLLQFQWSQSSAAPATNTIVKAGSTMTAYRIG